jgi:hypothetical protein
MHVEVSSSVNLTKRKKYEYSQAFLPHLIVTPLLEHPNFVPSNVLQVAVHLREKRYPSGTPFIPFNKSIMLSTSSTRQRVKKLIVTFSSALNITSRVNQR